MATKLRWFKHRLYEREKNICIYMERYSLDGRGFYLRSFVARLFASSIRILFDSVCCKMNVNIFHSLRHFWFVLSHLIMVNRIDVHYEIIIRTDITGEKITTWWWGNGWVIAEWMFKCEEEEEEKIQRKSENGMTTVGFGGFWIRKKKEEKFA